MNLIDAFKSGINQQINVGPEVFNDPFATTIEWTPLVRGGANFKTHEAKTVDGNRIEFKKTFMMSVFPFIFLIFPLVILILFFRNSGFSEIFGLIHGAVFAIIFAVFVFVGIFFWRFSSKSIVFDKVHGYFWKGKYDPRAISKDNEKDFIRLKDIYALQIVAEMVRGTKGSVYRSYELNLVKKSGERVNVVDHGNIKALRIDAKIIANFLQVPLWDATLQQ